MKKLSVGLSALMFLGIAACGESSDDAEPGLDQVSTQEQAADVLAQQSPARPKFPGLGDGGLPGFPGGGQLDEAKVKELIEKLKAALQDAGVKLPELPEGGKFPGFPGLGDGGVPGFPGAGGARLDEAKIKELIEKLKAALQDAGVKLPELPEGGKFPGFPGAPKKPAAE